MTEFSSSNKYAKVTYKKRKPKNNTAKKDDDKMLNSKQQNELIRLGDINVNKEFNNDTTATKNTVTSQESTNQGVVPSFVIGHIISEKELALASSHRKLNDVFDEFSELQRQSNTVSGKSGLKKSEKKSDVKNNQNRNSMNDRRGNNRKRVGGVSENDGQRKQKEIAKRALKSKPINDINERGKKVIVADTPTDKNYTQRNKLKKNKDCKDTADRANNDEQINIVNQEDDNNSEVDAFMTSTPNSTLDSIVLSQKMKEFANGIDSETGIDNNSNEVDVGNILPDSFPVRDKNDGQNSPKGQQQWRSRYSSQDMNMEQTQPQKGVRRFVLKPLPDDDDELEAFKTGNDKKD